MDVVVVLFSIFVFLFFKTHARDNMRGLLNYSQADTKTLMSELHPTVRSCLLLLFWLFLVRPLPRKEGRKKKKNTSVLLL